LDGQAFDMQGEKFMHSCQSISRALVCTALLASTAKAMRFGSRENPTESPDVRRSQGYRLTAHIRKYYKKAAA